MTQEEILQIGKPFIKHLRMCGNNPTRYRMSKKIKGNHSEGVVINEVVRKKIEKVAECAVANGAIIRAYAKGSKSIYFSFSGVAFRISDHPSNHFEGETILISFKTDLEPIFEFLKYCNNEK